jgi:hypothetical protein
MRKRITLLIAALMMALSMSLGGVAFAKIQTVDVSCENRGGQEPGGQQPSCKVKHRQGRTKTKSYWPRPGSNSPGPSSPDPYNERRGETV